MYADEPAKKSWSSPTARRDKRLTMNLAQSEHYRDSLAKDSELAYLSYPVEPIPKPVRNRPIDLQKAALTRNGSASPYSSEQRPSSYGPESTTAQVVDHRRTASSGQASDRFSTSSRSVSTKARSKESSPSRRAKAPSRSNSPHFKSDSLDRDYPPLPPSAPGSLPGTPPRQRTPTPTHDRTPPPQRQARTPTPTRQRTPELLGVPEGTSSSSISPSSSLPLKHPPYIPGSQSKTSLLPSEGEDLDGFHVRNTYALLELSGVKGDGFVEGIERTRARVGESRASQLNAENAVGDGSEKSQDLTSDQIHLLSSVDRYGFFDAPAHERLVLLPAKPLQKRLSPSGKGAPNAHPSPPQLESLPPTAPPIKEDSRTAKWTRMLVPDRRDQGGNVQIWTVKPSKEHKLRSRVYKGIPDRWRSAAWELLMGRFARVTSADMEQLGRDYREGLEKPSSYDIQIDLDVPRTISGHIMFRTRYGQGQRSLFHVLHSFSLRCPVCGYVQGMGPIAATLLCYFEPERVYASLVRLHDAYSLHTIFSPGFPGLLESIYVQERVTETMMPDVYRAFKRNMISTTSYATKWYITLFSNSVPFQTQLRLWDAFLLEGQDVFVAVAVAILWVYRDHITSTSASFETVLSLLSSFFVPQDEDVFMQWIEQALGNQTLRSYMRKWRSDWQQLVKDGKDGDVLL